MFQDLAIVFLGVIAGMLINYLSDVLPVTRRFTHPICLHCGETQTHQNYFLWPRRCPACGTRRSVRTWIVVIAFPALLYWLWVTPDSRMHYGFWIGFLVLAYFFLVTVIDVEHRLILHPVSWVGAFLFGLIGVLTNGWQSTLIGGTIGYMAMLALFFFGGLFARAAGRLRGTPIDEVALGFGDVNLTGVLGLLLGWPNIAMGVIISIFSAGAFTLGYLVILVLLRRYRVFMAIPYGPFLVLGGFMVLFAPAVAQQVLLWISPLFWFSP